MKAFVYLQLARTVRPASYDKAAKFVSDTFMKSATDDRKELDADDVRLQVHCLARHAATEASGAPAKKMIKKFEALYFEVNKEREHAKADYVEQTIKPIGTS